VSQKRHEVDPFFIRSRSVSVRHAINLTSNPNKLPSPLGASDPLMLVPAGLVRCFFQSTATDDLEVFCSGACWTDSPVQSWPVVHDGAAVPVRIARSVQFDFDFSDQQLVLFVRGIDGFLVAGSFLASAAASRVGSATSTAFSTVWQP